MLVDALLMLPHYSIYDIEVKYELNQKTLSARTLSKERISRTDLGIKLQLLENAKLGKII